MQRFVEADYYELDWYYEECTDVLCADRVGQMTKTYNDIDAVTRLLEEKERDLELAARIGQSLLKKNKTLSERNTLLEEQVEHIREEVSQLRHDLSMKDELLQFYTSAAEESDGESASTTPIRRTDSSFTVPNYLPLDSLQKKLFDLEEENIVLRSEANHLETETISYEEKEQQLVNDCVKELRDANIQISTIAEELARKTEDASRQQEEITHLLSQIVDLQKKAKSYALENEELTQHLGAAKDAQRALTAELRELEDKYVECMEMLHEAQEELKNFRNKTLPLSTPRRFHSLGLFPMDSLAAEIEGTMRKEIHLSDPDVEEQRLYPKRVFETVRNINQTVRQRSMGPSPMNIPGSNQTSCMNSRHPSCLSTPRSSMYGGDGVEMDNRNNSMLMETLSHQDSSDDSNRKPGMPGTPGSRDLEAALRRLSLRRDNYISEQRFFEEERERKLNALAEEKSELYEERHGGSGSDDGGPLTPAESIMSLGTLHSVYSIYSTRSYLPEKLQIVKPLEGSATLHAWQQLAQPHLGGILDTRPGVVTKGFRTLELDLEGVYQFTDLEEDEAGLRSPATSTSCLCSLPCSPALRRPFANNPDNQDEQLSKNGGNPGVRSDQMEAVDEEVLSVHFPGKCMSHTSSTYTFTTCRILHPSDELTRVTPSLLSGPSLASCVMSHSSLRSTPVSTPCTPRRLSLAESFTNLRDSTKTTSTSLGLVRLLQERGISAAVYNPLSWDRVDRAPPTDPCSSHTATPTHTCLDTLPSTPPNSPSKTKPTSHVFPVDYSPSDPPYETFLASRPASSILKEVLEADKRARTDIQCQTEVSVQNLRLVDKVKKFSLAPRTLTPGMGRPGPPFGAHAVVTSPMGGLPVLNSGMRRNRSYPAMVGASMAMKGPGPPSEDVMLAPGPPRRTSLNEK
ncbi:trafficking kinesin-binding protein 1-like isoform X3 [Carassius gibelio]|uniref:trafficking kinesin-binding protein 1-like isoform X3 n=1 Tax=Carassius gibelio TaxID=101364 RepID=UPI002277770F|nr:trafficking kinesin-binding protein 1-like isoform X3 [Carassius gibelio]XP_052475033.1 trafficking kinesin-binding protein 1-like isoform X3 [Carassius gibelio]